MFESRRVVLLAIAAAGCCQWLVAQDLGPIGIVRSGRETVAVVEVEGCKASLDWMPTESLLRYRNDCGQALDRKIRIFSALAEKLSADYGDFERSRSLSIGRLSVTFPTLARQISLAAYKSPKWDIKRGRAAASGQLRFGAENDFFRDMANELKLFEPLSEALKPYGLSARAASVEKVLAGTPKQLPFGDWLLKHGVAPTAKLPFDGQMWLRLEPAAEAK